MTPAGLKKKPFPLAFEREVGMHGVGVLGNRSEGRREPPTWARRPPSEHQGQEDHSHGGLMVVLL